MSTQINLAEELAEHYHVCRKARDDVLIFVQAGENLGSAASVLNATTNALKELVKMQEDLHNIEKIKAYERVIIRFISKQDNKEQLLQELEQEIAHV